MSNILPRECREQPETPGVNSVLLEFDSLSRQNCNLAYLSNMPLRTTQNEEREKMYRISVTGWIRQNSAPNSVIRGDESLWKVVPGVKLNPKMMAADSSEKYSKKYA